MEELIFKVHSKVTPGKFFPGYHASVTVTRTRRPTVTRTKFYRAHTLPALKRAYAWAWKWCSKIEAEAKAGRI